VTSDINTRAAQFVEAEKKREAELAARRKEQQEATRLANARRHIKQHDREIAAEQARKEAEVEANEVAVQRRELEELLERRAAALNHSLAELEALDRRHRDALRRAGRPVGHGQGLSTVIPRWFAHRFGGANSPTGIIGSHPTGKERTLAERDPLSQAGNRGDVA
jgi:hypothetical protein